MDDALVERCAQAAWEAGRCSPLWGSRSQIEANRETYRRSSRVVLEEAMRAGFLPPDSAARLRAVVRLEREADAIFDASLDDPLPTDWDRLDTLDAEISAAHAALTEADLGITTTTEETP